MKTQSDWSATNLTRTWSGPIVSAKRLFGQLFTPDARCLRGDYWWFTLEVTILALIVDLGLLLSPVSWGTWPWTIVLIVPLFGWLIATIQRLHDVGHTGFYLVWLLVPIFGWILVIRQLARPATYAPTPTKKRSSSLALIALIVVLISPINQALTWQQAWLKVADNVLAHGGKSKVTVQTPTLTFSELKLADDTIRIRQQADYPVTVNKTSAHTRVAVSKVTIYQTAKTYGKDVLSDHDKRFNGVIEIAVKITAKQPLEMYPTQGVLTTDQGTKVTADIINSALLDGKYRKNQTKQGNLVFLLPKLTDVRSFKTLKLVWDMWSSADTANSFEQKLTIPLTK
ncbi:DUF805 domain-containing protein [Lactiplantibacillus fabifermentans]|uniref:DUF805 domain-containing protein n=1 Tax=Lactiplantibacillus fabifermentans T30PCM01 TaxID=1400520 RepID=W6T9M2_9LACO|nr:DUF805 domain-containing protein [Lactiplantibacillus fabifermentans]ETY74578.1 hypothetical protein LFAB_06865 [Lactiplantibacillus fabifermentans T30PCM01]